MQVLTRTIQQSIRIGRDTKITVICVRGDQVRFRIDTPTRAYKQEVLAELDRAATVALPTSELPPAG